MKCELCSKNDAETVLFRRTESGTKEELYVCGACAARERAFEQQHGIQIAAMDASSILSDAPFPAPPVPPQLPEKLQEQMEDFFGASPEQFEPASDDPIQPKTCPQCGMALDEIHFAFRIGCARCYDTFREELKELFSDLQGCTEFRGNHPAWVAEKFRLNELKRKLKTAIEHEQFAEAKQLMLQIRALRKALNLTDEPPEEDHVN